MKLSQITSYKWFVQIILLIAVLTSVFVTVYKDTASPPCFNADEAAFGYNAYSILKTGADEYGSVLPLRLKSFGDNKMPLYTYLSVPFVGAFGLNEFSVRALNILIAGLFPVAIYFLTKELFKKKEIALLGAMLISVCLGKGIIAREAHEALLAALLITLASYFFLKYINSSQLKYGIFFTLSLFLSLFSYQSSRLFAGFFLVFALCYLFFKKTHIKSKKAFLSFFIIALLLFGITDVIYKPARVQNLFLTSNAGFSMEIKQLLDEGSPRLVYNKLTVGTRDVLTQYMQYYSPQFLAENGDLNARFGFAGMSPLTPLEYLFIFVGIYFLFRNKERWRYYILSLLLITPLTAALSWQSLSLTRSFFLLIPALIISSYGFYYFVAAFTNKKIVLFLIAGLVLIEGLFLFYSWDFYLNHYPKRAIVAEAWQCGYSEVASFVKSNYNKYDTFYITQKNGQPYIFMLFYLEYPPKKYQMQATLTAPDQFGFGQVEKFDKFNFSFPSTHIHDKRTAFIGYPDDFQQLPIDMKKIKKIKADGLDIFWIYTND